MNSEGTLGEASEKVSGNDESAAKSGPLSEELDVSRISKSSKEDAAIPQSSPAPANATAKPGIDSEKIADSTCAAAQVADDPEDPELSELLDSALADFGRPTIPVGRSQPNTTSGASAAADGAAEPSDENLSQAYQTFEEAMRQAMQAGGSDGAAAPQALSSAIAALAEQAARAQADGCDEPLARTLSDLSRELSADATQAGAGEPDVAELLRTFAGDADAPAAGDGGGDGLESLMPLMQTVMQSILSKEVLYPALRDVCDRYPAWLEQHGPGLPADQQQRYRQQHELMRQVCAAYEAPEDDEQRKRVFTLMQQIQALGQPPKELVGESPLTEMGSESGIPQLSGALPGGEECNVM